MPTQECKIHWLNIWRIHLPPFCSFFSDYLFWLLCSFFHNNLFWFLCSFFHNDFLIWFRDSSVWFDSLPKYLFWKFFLFLNFFVSVSFSFLEQVSFAAYVWPVPYEGILSISASASSNCRLNNDTASHLCTLRCCRAFLPEHSEVVVGIFFWTWNVPIKWMATGCVVSCYNMLPSRQWFFGAMIWWCASSSTSSQNSGEQFIIDNMILRRDVTGCQIEYASHRCRVMGWATKVNT